MGKRRALPVKVALGKRLLNCRSSILEDKTCERGELPIDSGVRESWDSIRLIINNNNNDVTVASPLTPAVLNEVSISAGATAYGADNRKHATNDTRCQELGWMYIPLAVELYGNWGKEAQCVFSRLASLLAVTNPKWLLKFIDASTCHW